MKNKYPLTIVTLALVVMYASLLAAPVLAMKPNQILIDVNYVGTNNKKAPGTIIAILPPDDSPLVDPHAGDYVADNSGKVRIDTTIETQYATGTWWVWVYCGPTVWMWTGSWVFTLNDRGSAQLSVYAQLPP
jgi:hypothetical protein